MDFHKFDHKYAAHPSGADLAYHAKRYQSCACVFEDIKHIAPVQLREALLHVTSRGKMYYCVHWEDKIHRSGRDNVDLYMKDSTDHIVKLRFTASAILSVAFKGGPPGPKGKTHR